MNSKMKKYFSLIVLLIAVVVMPVVAFGQRQRVYDHRAYYFDKAKELNELYQLATTAANDRESYQRDFFNRFPNNFSDLAALYGFRNDIPALLYEEYQAHFNELFDHAAVSDTLLYEKLMRIAIDGHWDGDAINYFQHKLRDKTENNTELMVYLLSGLPQAKVVSFWTFYLDGAHPTKQIPERLKKIKAMNPHVYESLVMAHKKLAQDWNTHWR